MPQVKAYDEVPNPRVRRQLSNGTFAWRTSFIVPPEDKSIDSPVAFLSERTPDAVLRPHFHRVDQFQVIYSGSATFGTHALRFAGVHFARAYTPYGPIQCGQEGMGFVTLRAHRNAGVHYMPDSRKLLEETPNRTPWQITEMADFNLDPGGSGIAMKAMEGMNDDRGLAGFSVVMRPGARAYSIDPSKGDGQHIVIVKGGLMHEGRHKKGLAVVWVSKDEPPFEMIAGPDGCEAIILNYPRPGGGSPDKARPVSTDGKDDFKTYQCVLCAFIYDEAQGVPEYGIAPGTRWADVPATFGCPDCDARKSDFQMIEF